MGSNLNRKAAKIAKGRGDETKVGTGGSPYPLSRHMAVCMRGGMENEEQPPAGEVEVCGANLPGPTKQNTHSPRRGMCLEAVESRSSGRFRGGGMGCGFRRGWCHRRSGR